MSSPDWYPDPSARHQYRWWDGKRWTEHVSSNGHPSVEEGLAAPAVENSHDAPELSPAPPRAQLFAEPFLHLEPGPGIVRTDFEITNGSGQLVGTVHDGRLGRNRDIIFGPEGQPLLWVARNVALLKGGEYRVGNPDFQFATVDQVGLIGKLNMDLTVGHQKVAELRGENGRDTKFHVVDGHGNQIASGESTRHSFIGDQRSWDCHIRPGLEFYLNELLVASIVVFNTAGSIRRTHSSRRR